VSGERAPDEAAVTALEAAMADTGALLVRTERYRAGAEAARGTLAHEALRLGDEARALHRHGSLDGEAALTLLGRARALGARIEAVLADVQAAPEYTAALAAVAAGDHAVALRLLPQVFAGLETVATPPTLYHALAWRRRGRARTVADLVAEVLRARDRGLMPEGDDLSRGADARLPAVMLLDVPPDDEPAALTIDGARVGPRVLRLADTGEYLVHVPSLRALGGVHVADALPPDELEAGAEDYARFRAELIAALGRAGVRVTTPGPAAATAPHPPRA
jgi:hypothetical protein